MTGNKQLDLSDLPPPWDRIFSFVTKLFVWCLLFGVLYFLRSFFLLVFLTFVFSYIQTHGVDALKPYVRNRTLRVVLMGVLFLGVLASVGLFVVPRVTQQAKTFADNYTVYLSTFDSELNRMATQYPLFQRLLPHRIAAPDALPGNPDDSPTVLLLRELMGIDHSANESGNVRYLMELLRNIGKPLLAIGSAFLLSLLFSFLIVLDLPRLTKGVKSLRNTKLGFIYEEVADSIKNFGQELGHALQAQLIIAALNTTLTAAIIYYLGLEERLAFLSVIVFLCGFIPVAGVFISSVPICLLSLQASGFSGLLIAGLLIWIVHLIEAYVLNPRIFGSRLHLNPVMVLIILTIAGKLFGVWGLVLSLPVCRYIFGHAIQRRPAEPSVDASQVALT